MRHPELVKEDMTQHAVTVRPDEDLYHAYSIMQRCQFHHLPVVENGVLVGILSDRDILRCGHLRDGVLTVGNRTVRDAMVKGAVTCRQTDRIGDAVDVMLKTKVDALTVVDERGAVLGILTTTDLLIALRRLEGVLDVGALLEKRS